MTMTLIESKTLGTAAASIEFTSIPQDGTDLLVKLSMRTDRSTNPAFFAIRFNDATTNQTVRRLTGYGDGVDSTSASNSWSMVTAGASQTASTFGNAEVYIPNYTGSTNKSFSVDWVYENNATAAYQGLVAGLWSDTAAITKITVNVLADNSASFVAGSTISLYKVTKGSDGIVTTS
jgi:hypothetical protein